jgi:hypothetical protein
MWMRRAITTLAVVAGTAAAQIHGIEAAGPGNVTAGVVAINGTATATPGIGTLTSPGDVAHCDFFPQTMQWYVSAQGVAGGMATVLNLAGNAYPPSGVTVTLTIVTCQDAWFGGPPGDLLSQVTPQITGSIDGSAPNGSTFSCSLSGSQYSYTLGVVGMGGQGQCTVDRAPVTVSFGFHGVFLPTSSSGQSTTATVAGAFTLSP